MVQTGNLFAPVGAAGDNEVLDTLAIRPGLRLLRIVSSGQATPTGEWYDQEDDEWVVLLSGGAGLLFEGEARVRDLDPGDWLLIPAHARHRIEWTAKSEPTVWLALHLPPEG